MNKGQRRMWRNTCVSLVLLAFAAAPVKSQARVRKDLVDQLSEVYEQWHRACTDGNVEGFLKARDPEEVARTVERFGLQISADLISAQAEWIPPIRSLEFIGVVRDGDWAQLRYHGGDAEPDAAGARIRFHVLLFHLHPDGWKLAVPGSVGHRKFIEGGKEVTIEDIEIPDRMRLPSQRVDPAESGE